MAVACKAVLAACLLGAGAPVALGESSSCADGVSLLQSKYVLDKASPEPTSCLVRSSCEGAFRYVAPEQKARPAGAEARLTDLLPHNEHLTSAQSIEECASLWEASDLKSGNKQNVKSTNNEDMLIFDRFFRSSGSGPRTSAFYLEMGAFDGITESNSLFFERCLGWKGLLVEANPVTYNIMLRNDTRPLAHKLNMAPSCESDHSEVEFDAVAYTSAGQVDFVGGGAPHNLVKVHCGPLSLYLKELGIKEIDFFSLDVEGAELDVLKTIDFGEVKIRVLMAESWNRLCQADCPKREAVRKLMLSKGYKLDTKIAPRSDVFYLEGM